MAVAGSKSRSARPSNCGRKKREQVRGPGAGYALIACLADLDVPRVFSVLTPTN
jgi:hypothetical protein